MIDPIQEVEAEFSLCEEDFPSSFKNMAHEDDYKIIDTYFKPEFIYHKNGKHRRLILRICWKIKNTEQYIPISFVCDTGAPYYLYLSSPAKKILSANNLIEKDDKEDEYIYMSHFKAGIEGTPKSHQPANIIGLSSLLNLNLCLHNTGFSIDENIKYF